MNERLRVIKLAQPGYDAKTAGDENLIYSSQWPLLKIYKQGSAAIGDVTQETILATHDLPFPPMFWIFSNATLSAYLNAGVLQMTNRSEFFGPIGDASVAIDTKSLVYKPVAFPATTGSMRLYYYMFALDLSKQYTAPSFNVGSISGARNTRHVFKIAKEGKSIDSDRLDDYVIHSRARSPLIHSVNPSNGIVKNFAVTHSLEYLPMFFGYTKGNDGRYTLIPTGQGGSSSFQSTDKTVTFADSGGKEITIVVLKDPFNLDHSVSVNI